MSTLHIVSSGDNIKVIVNKFCEMERPQDEWAVILCFLDSLLEMCVITSDQHAAKCERVRMLAGL